MFPVGPVPPRDEAEPTMTNEDGLGNALEYAQLLGFACGSKGGMSVATRRQRGAVRREAVLQMDINAAKRPSAGAHLLTK